MTGTAWPIMKKSHMMNPSGSSISTAEKAPASARVGYGRSPGTVCRLIVFNSARACPRDTPSASRPYIHTAGPSPLPKSADRRRNGSQICSVLGMAKPSGITPTIVVGTPAMRSVLPTTSWAPPRRLRQKPCPTTATSGAPFTSSDGNRTRPIIGGTRVSANKEAVIRALLSPSDQPSPEMMLTSNGIAAPIEANVVLRSRSSS
jgi:hypothetical protein